MGQRRLDEFGDAGDAAPPSDGADDWEDTGEPSGPSDPGEAAGSDPAVGTATGLSAGPATVTMAADPGGAVCEACGERVRRRWRGDGDDRAGALVCSACKEW